MKIINARYCKLNGKVITCDRHHTSVEIDDDDLFITFTNPLFIINVHAYEFMKCLEIDEQKYDISLYFNDFGIELNYKFTKSGFKKVFHAIQEKLDLIDKKKKKSKENSD